MGSLSVIDYFRIVGRTPAILAASTLSELIPQVCERYPEVLNVSVSPGLLPKTLRIKLEARADSSLEAEQLVQDFIRALAGAGNLRLTPLDF